MNVRMRFSRAIVMQKIKGISVRLHYLILYSNLCILFCTRAIDVLEMHDINVIRQIPIIGVHDGV